MTLAQSFEPDKNPQLIFMTDTEQGRLQVLKNEGFIWLTINDILQTAIELKPPYISALPHCMVMLLPLLHDSLPTKVLELGAGGLAIQRFMAQIHPSIEVTSVEIQPEIIKAVQQYFPESDQLNVVEDDALHYVDSAIEQRKTFDYLLVDIYRGQESPVLQSNNGMLSQFDQLLCPGGWLVINCLTADEQRLSALKHELQQQFSVSPKVFAVPEMLNHIFMLKKNCDFCFPADIEQYNLG